MVDSNSSFLLQDDEGNNIAVISKKGKRTPSKFNAAIGLAVKEHFNADSVVVNRVEDELTLTVDTIEDEEKNIRVFTLEQIEIY
jgi:hypothetical protein